MDGDYEVIHSSTVNVYDNRLTFENIYGFKIVFIFTTSEDKKTNIFVEGVGNTGTVTVKNFNNPLGAATTKKMEIIRLEGKIIYLSLFAKSLNEETSLLQVTTTFYIK